MNMQVIAQIEAVNNELSELLRVRLAKMTSRELVAAGEILMEHPEMSLAHFAMIQPKDTAAMLALHFYREALRRLEIEAMNHEG